MWHLWPEFHCNWCLYITSLPEASFMSYEYFKCAFSYTLLCTQHYLKCYISFITWPTRLNPIYMMHNAKIIIHCFGWPLTLVRDLWPHWRMMVPMLHLWPKFQCNYSLYREEMAQDKKCIPNSWHTHRRRMQPEGLSFGRPKKGLSHILARISL